jgi:protein-L-isoaspartate(D-aspartate) O-methyltransferase
MEELIKSLIERGVLKSPTIAKALKKVDRADFVPSGMKDLAYADEALPIGETQTISQPYTVVFMLELLEPKEGERIMDVGSGSMWQSAILAEIAGDKGKVYSIEINKDIFEFGKTNISKYPELMKRIETYNQNADPAPTGAKLDGVIAAAEVAEVPQSWRDQLNVNGRLVYPKNGSIFLEIKRSEHEFEVSQFPGFAFVPFV